MRILALSSWWPEPADNGARLRIAHLLRALAERHEVHLLAFGQEPVDDDQRRRMRQICASVDVVPQRLWAPNRVAVLSSLWHAEPASVRTTYNTEFAARVRAISSVIRPHTVIAFELAAAPYAALVPGVPRIFEEVEVGRLWEQYAHAPTLRRKGRDGLTWWKHQQYLRALLRQFDACSVVSGPERDHVRRIAPPNLPIVVIPNGADVSLCDGAWGEAEPDTLVYPGALSYDANFDAMAHFIKDSFPLIKAQRPATLLRITGRVAAAQRTALHADGIEWTGYVPDVRPVIARSWGEVVPLRVGGGTRLKVLEALALGTPIVSTSKGVEGLDVRHDRHVLIADTPANFAAATARLLSDHELRARMAQAGRQFVRDHYDWRTIGGQLHDLIDDVVDRIGYAHATHSSH